jgi:predicted dehydrogenase
MSVLKAAILGGGHIAGQNHIPALKQLSDQVEILAICGRDLTKTRVLAGQHGIPEAFDDIHILFDTCKPDLVINCTPNNLHYDFTMEALKNGCHVLCEKPPAMTAAQAREMADLAREQGKVLAYNFQRRQTPEYLLLKKCLQSGQLGEVYHIKANYLRRRGIPGWGNFTNKAIQGGGALIDLGVHILDLALGMLDYRMPDKINGNTYDFIGKTGGKGLKGQWDPARFDVDDACFAYLSFSNNSSITLSCSFALNQKEEEIINLEVFGSKAGAVLNPFSLHTEVAGELADIRFPHLEETNPQLKNTAAFINAILGQESNICTGEEGAILQEIVDKIYQSADQPH